MSIKRTTTSLYLLLLSISTFASGHMLNGIQYIIPAVLAIWSLGFFSYLTSKSYVQNSQTWIKAVAWILAVPSLIIGAVVAYFAFMGSTSLLIALAALPSGLAIYGISLMNRRDKELAEAPPSEKL